MHIWRILLALAGATLLTAQTAPPPAADPVIAHYRAYRTAFAAGDFTTADTEADAALQASVARDGQGGRTGVLALNLAQLRLARQRNAEAYAPAQQALDIATHNSASGVDPLLARLTLGRAELTPEHEQQGRALITAALADVGPRTDLHAEAYDAARALGGWSFVHGEYNDAITGWQNAQLYAESAQMDRTDALAEALIGEGSARYTKAASAQFLERDRPNDTHLHFPAAPQYQRAMEAFVEAENRLLPYAYTPGADETVTLSQSLFSRAYASRLLLRSYLASTDQAVPVVQSNDPETIVTSGGPPCIMNVVMGAPPNFPPGALSFGQVEIGTVVVRFHLNEAGEIVDRRVTASVPPGGVFQTTVEQAAAHWRVERDASSPAGCKVPALVFEAIRFTGEK